MKLTVFNGSPRGKGSNTRILMERFFEEFSAAGGKDYSIEYLVKVDEHPDYVRKFTAADTVLIAFPLYTDSMPGIVTAFVEALAPLKGKCAGKKIGFIVQSGFPEAIHSSFIPMYLEKLCKRLGAEYIGTVIKGGVEGIQIMPPSMTKKLFGMFAALGAYFAVAGEFDPYIMAKLAKPFRMGLFSRFFIRLMSKIGVINFFWDSQLKKNNAFGRRFDAPFVK